MGKFGRVIKEDEHSRTVAVSHTELCMATAERASNITVAIAKAYAVGAKTMALACFEALGEYIDDGEGSGAPFLPKMDMNAALHGLRIAFEGEGADLDDFLAYRNKIGNKESKLFDK